MAEEFVPGADPEEIKHFLHGLGLIPLNEYYTQVKQLLKRQGQSSKTTHEQIQRKLTENGIHKDDSTKNMPLFYSRKRTSFSPVITRKRGKAIRKRTPSDSQVTTTVITSTTIDHTESVTEKVSNENNMMMDYDEPLDLRLQTKSTSKS